MGEHFEFDAEKNAQLQEQRGIAFEEIIAAIHNGDLLDIIEHPNKKMYAHQKIYVIEIGEYVYLVPFVETENGTFLKTISPSRKLMKQYLKKRYDCRGKNHL